jgi:hypothetical protein
MGETALLEDLERATELAARAFAAAVPEQRSERAVKDAEHLTQRFGHLGRQGAHSDAIAVLEQAPPNAQIAPAVRVRWLELAGHAYLNRHRVWGVEYSHDVRRAQDCFQHALKILPPGDSTRIPQLLGLAEALEHMLRLAAALEHSHRAAEARELPIELLEQAVAEAANLATAHRRAEGGHRAPVAGLPTELLSRALPRAVEGRRARAGQGAGACRRGRATAPTTTRRRAWKLQLPPAARRTLWRALAGRRRTASLRGDRGLGRVYVRRTPRRGPS